ncbi:hypothetical protein S83_025695, partial [Arachis hypogaea]
IKYILGSNGHIFFQVVGYASGNYKISLKNWSWICKLSKSIHYCLISMINYLLLKGGPTPIDAATLNH